MIERIVIFGAGKFGRQARLEYKNQVIYFIDNNPKMKGRYIDGILVRSLSDYVLDNHKYKIIIASKSQDTIAKQLDENGITNYEMFLNTKYAYFNSSDIIYNPYDAEDNRDLDEKAWNNNIVNEVKIKQIGLEVENAYNNNKLFEHIEIETINRCNGVCSFCPVSKNNDTRKYAEMSDELFERIINQLADIDYRGKLALFSNNEPLLDPKIIERHDYARKKLPNARMHLFTNGTLLTLELFTKLMRYLDELIIDNYHQELKLIKPCQEIVDYCFDKPDLRKKVTIVLRKPNEILTSRGGDAPNRKELKAYSDVKCVLPFKQMIIRPDGKVSLCCNDPLGKNTLADLTKENIIEAWENQRYKTVRESLYKGRGNWNHCIYCDTFSLG